MQMTMVRKVSSLEERLLDKDYLILVGKCIS